MNFSETCDYSEEDSSIDADLILEQLYDINSAWTNVNYRYVRSQTDTGNVNQESDIICHHYAKFAETLRYVNFSAQTDTLAIQKLSNLDVSYLNDFTSDQEETIPTSVSLKGFKFSELPFKCSLDDSRLGNLPVASSHDASFKQLRRDIERDKLIINSNLIVGADGGIEKVLSTFREICEKLLEEVNLPLSDLMAKSLRDYAIACLGLASRTNSGGIAFHTLQSVIESNQISLVPLSSQAPPLLLRIYATPFIDSIDGSWTPRFKCVVESSTVFKILYMMMITMDDENENESFASEESNETPDIVLKVTYKDSIDYYCSGKEVLIEKHCNETGGIIISRFN